MPHRRRLSHANAVPLWAGAGLALSIAAAAMLAVDHFLAGGVAGCGPGSGCERAAASRWGSIPGAQWPVSFVGLAFYLGLAGAWLAGRRRSNHELRLLTRFGVAVAAAYLLVMVFERILCPYCLAAHLGMILFWLGVERAATTQGATPRSAVAFLATAAATTLALIPLELNARQSRLARAEAALQSSTAEMVAAATQPSREPRFQEGLAEAPAPGRRVGVLPSRLAAPGGEAPPREGETGVPPSARSQVIERSGAGPNETAGFTGRYRLGPQPASVRIVIFSDYQCSDCRRIESEARSLVESRGDVSLSAKHFPMSSDCNPHMPTNMHPNACWAARAAEAAGMLDDAEGFWRMHRWLFDRGGAFTGAELRAALPGLGFEPGAFMDAMAGGETLRRVRSDIEEAIDVGLHFTPMIFINGVELRGWNAPNALTRAVEAVAAANPPPRTAVADHPPAAIEKYVQDWRAQPKREMNDTIDWALGGGHDAVEVVLFGDYSHDLTALADAILRAVVERERSETGAPKPPRIRYHFRHFPFDAGCNPAVPHGRSAHPFACRAAAAAEAAGRLGGPDGYWRMHQLLMQNHAKVTSDDELRDLATAAGFDPAALFDLIDSAEVKAAIAEDVDDARRLGVQGIPALFVNGRLVPRWRRDGEGSAVASAPRGLQPSPDTVLSRILSAAERE